MTASNKTIEELKAVVTEELQVLKGHLGTVNGFFDHMVVYPGGENVWVMNHAAICERAARVLDQLKIDTEALFKLVGNESSSSSEGGRLLLRFRRQLRYHRRWYPLGHRNGNWLRPEIGQNGSHGLLSYQSVVGKPRVE